MERIPYDPSEFRGEYIEARGGKAPVFHPPVTPRENTLALFRGEDPLWMPLSNDCKNFSPRLAPDNVARGFVFDGEGPYDAALYGGKDMFGVEWVYVPVAGGSMVKPGSPMLLDANDWKEVIKIPDVNAWDWEGSARANAAWFEANKDYVETITFLNGTGFERLISFMDFEGAAMAVIDEDQVDAVKDLLNAIYDRVYVPYIENVVKYYPQIRKISLHDDWGSQRAPFFSIDVARDIFVPILQKFAAKCREHDLIFELHSCGKNEMVVPAYIEGGVQTWNGMSINDKRKLYEKYGDRFIFGVDPPAAAGDMHADPKALEEAAREFCEFYIRDGKCHAVANCMRANPDFVAAVYRISRQMLN